MRNIAKCKLCLTVIESFHSTDYVMCKCGEIALDGGDAMKCYANDFKNLIRVDEKGNEIIVTVLEAQKELLNPISNQEKLSKDDLIKMLDDMAKNIEKLPQHAMLEPITHYDHWCLITLLVQILKNYKSD